jgi:DNA-binding NarL/FixJ family response regulator
MSPYRIVLADDHILLRQGIKSIIESSPEMAVVGEADDGLDLLQLLKTISPEMIVLDISMPNLRGIEAIREIKAINPRIKILMLSMHKEKEFLYHAFAAGADGYLLKEDTDTELFTAIETIRAAEIYISPILTKQLAGNFIESLRGVNQIPEEPLTTREREVLKLLAEGKSSKEIASLLYISARTVDHHRASIMKKLNFSNIAALVKYAIRKGYTTSLS